MTHPISNERVQWLTDRAKVLDKCIERSTSQMYSMQSGGALRDDLMNVLKRFREERTAVAIEITILNEHFDVKP